MVFPLPIDLSVGIVSADQLRARGRESDEGVGGRAESDQQEEARVRRGARATRNIFGAIRRGDGRFAVVPRGAHTRLG